jgi:hypothetical protein
MKNIWKYLIPAYGYYYLIRHGTHSRRLKWYHVPALVAWQAFVLYGIPVMICLR